MPFQACLALCSFWAIINGSSADEREFAADAEIEEDSADSDIDIPEDQALEDEVLGDVVEKKKKVKFCS